MNTKVKEEYRGYQICHHKSKNDRRMLENTDYYYIAKDKVRISNMCFYSIKACKNAINTYFETPPRIKHQDCVEV